MDKQVARTIVDKHRLIPGKISRQVLWAIQNDTPIEKDILPDSLSLKKIEELRSQYKREISASIPRDKTHPRNQVFYELIQKRFPGFSWKTYDTSSGKENVVFNAPRVNNLEVSLLSLLVGDFHFENHSALLNRYGFLKKFPESFTHSLSELFQNIQVIYPDELSMRSFISWLEKGMAGESLNIFSLACPDYSVEKIDDPQSPLRHTFNELGSGIGLIAQRILDALPTLTQFLEKFEVKITITLAMADYEALSQYNLKRLNLSFKEFSRRIEESRKAFQKASAIQIDTPMVTELCGGYEAWASLHAQFRNKLNYKDFGRSQLDQQKLCEIINTRKQLYDRWHGPLSDTNDYLSILLDQGAEYSVIGKIISEKYKNCLILGADHSSLAPFYSINTFIPSIYLKRFYC